jgi:Caudovirus prohead serine protease
VDTEEIRIETEQDALLSERNARIRAQWKSDPEFRQSLRVKHKTVLAQRRAEEESEDWGPWLTLWRRMNGTKTAERRAKERCREFWEELEKEKARISEMTAEPDEIAPKKEPVEDDDDIGERLRASEIVSASRTARKHMYSDITHLPLQRREAELDRVTKDSRLVHFSFSSEAEVQRPFGVEILSHREGAIDVERLEQGCVPLLYQHDFERQIGQVISYRLGTTKAYGTAKLSTTPLAEQTWQDMRAGTRPSISVGYLPRKMVLMKAGSGDEQNVYLVTRWSVLEVSSVGQCQPIRIQA